MEDLLATGLLKSSHGVRGEMKVHSYSDEYAHFFKLEKLLLRNKDGRERTCLVEGFRMNGGELLVKLQGIDSPEATKALAGWEIWIPRSSAAQLCDGEVYVKDLCACSLTVGGLAVAKVVSAIDGPQALLLEVETPDARKYLVPYMAQYLGAVDLMSGTIELLAPWLLS
ncbi:MAG: ribosome maturation factor RimM [Sphaerochaetaceae bacterium]|nr:ribosome maturation factor RimM [Sphaerochaetaceae bacterium]